MKFVCERCQTKYSIADDKVRQKVLKIRCKTCENVITIRDAVVVASSVAAAPPPAPAPRPATRFVEWHVAINGQQDGPFALSSVVSRVLSARKDEEIYVWNEHLDGWKEPKDIPEVAAELRARASALPPPLPGKRPLPPPFAGGGGHHRPASGSQSSHGSGAHALSAAGPASMPVFGGDEEDRTQIQPLDAGMMLDAGKREKQDARHDAKHDPKHAAHAKGTNGSGAPALNTGLEGLDLGLPRHHAPAGGMFAAAAAAGAHSAPAVAASGLSQIAGLPAVVGRHPAIKYVAAGTVLVGLIVVIAVMTMNKEKAPKPDPIAALPAAVEPPPPAPPSEAPRPVEHAGTAPQVPAPKNPLVGGRKPLPVARAPVPATKKGPDPRVTAPPPISATNVAPPPVGGVESNDVEVAKHYAPRERPVVVPRRDPNAGGGGANGPDFNQTQFAAVISQQDHRAAVRSCYERALKRDERLKVGRLEVTVDVGETGSVKKVSIEAPPEFAAVSSCIREVVRRWRFPSSSKDYEGSFPLLLQGG